MTTENVVSPGAETENTAPDIVENQDLTTPETSEEAPQQAAEEDPLKAAEKRLEKERANFQRRIDRKHAQAVEAAERARVLEQRLQQYESEKPEKSEVDVETLAQTRARELLEQQTLQRKVRDVLEKGKAIEGFDVAASAAIEELGLVDNNMRPTAHLSALLDTDAPHELLAFIGTHPEVTDSLHGLSPSQFAYRLARVETQMREAKQPQRSKAPQPLKTVAPQASSSELSDDLPMSEWVKRREEQIKKRQGY